MYQCLKWRIIQATWGINCHHKFPQTLRQVCYITKRGHIVCISTLFCKICHSTSIKFGDEWLERTNSVLIWCFKLVYFVKKCWKIFKTLSNLSFWWSAMILMVFEFSRLNLILICPFVQKKYCLVMTVHALFNKFQNKKTKN